MSEPAPPDARVVVGRHTYGHDASTFLRFRPEAEIHVGAFCSIAPAVRILGGGEHLLSRATTWPLNYFLFAPGAGPSLDATEKGPTRIGHDVWIGLGAIVLGGVMVGHGAVIGAGAVVRRPVPPYAVVTGNPARIDRYRFDAATRRRLLALRWWEWEDAEIMTLREAFLGEVGTFLDAAERGHGSPGPCWLTRTIAELPPSALTPARGRARWASWRESARRALADRILGR